jgi:hypothetical protein
VPPYRPLSGTRYFTHYWANETWEENSRQEGKQLIHTAGNLFRSRGVTIGDFVYVVTVLAGRLFLLGRIEVGAMLDQGEAEAKLGERLWAADEHIIARSRTESPQRFGREVPMNVTESLRFMGGEGPAMKLAFDADGLLDRQTMRGVRELTNPSAAALDPLLG